MKCLTVLGARHGGEGVCVPSRTHLFAGPVCVGGEAGTGLWRKASCWEIQGDLEADQKTQTRSALEEADDEYPFRRPVMWDWRRQQWSA